MTPAQGSHLCTGTKFKTSNYLFLTIRQYVYYILRLKGDKCVPFCRTILQNVEVFKLSGMDSQHATGESR